MKLPLVKRGDDLPLMIVKAAESVGGLKDGDIVVVTSKAVSAAQGRIKDLSKIRPSARAKKIAARTGQPPEFVEVVLREADKVLRVNKGVILTVKDGLISANAGADLSNVVKGHAALLPVNPAKAAEEIRQRLSAETKAKVGVIISDSVVHPLRLGTVGQAIAVAGMEPVIDSRGELDLYGKPLRITFRAIADQLATAAQVVMGEAGERVPAVVMRDTCLELVDMPRRSPKISPKRCIYFGGLKLPA